VGEIAVTPGRVLAESIAVIAVIGHSLTQPALM